MMTFYQYALRYRGAPGTEKGTFAEAMYHYHDFPKEEGAFDPLSRYIEERSDVEMPARVFDALWEEYEEHRG